MRSGLRYKSFCNKRSLTAFVKYSLREIYFSAKEGEFTALLRCTLDHGELSKYYSAVILNTILEVENEVFQFNN